MLLTNNTVTQIKPFALTVCRKYSSKRFPTDELYSVCLVALPNICAKFNPDRGMRFTSFAYMMFSFAIKNHLRTNSQKLAPANMLQDLEAPKPVVPNIVPNLETMLSKAHKHITDKQRAVLQMRLGAIPHTLQQCATKMGISAPSVSRLEKRGILALHRCIKQKDQQ